MSSLSKVFKAFKAPKDFLSLQKLSQPSLSNTKNSCSNSHSISSCLLHWQDSRWEHPLIYQNYIQALSQPEFPPYPLSELCASSADKSDSEVFPLFMQQNFLSSLNFTPIMGSGTTQIQSLANLSPFLTSAAIKPDFFIESPEKYPLLLVEIESGNDYMNALSKGASNLLDQLRSLRHTFDISVMSSYVLPSSKTAKHVTKITVEWKENLLFYFSYKQLSKNEFMKDVACELEMRCNGLLHWPKYSDPQHHYFIRLSQNNLKYLQGIFKTENLKQHESKFSILTFDSNYFYKIVMEYSHNIDISLRQMYDIKTGEENTEYSHLVGPDMFFFTDQKQIIWRFPRQHYNYLSREEAFNCLGDLTQQVVMALTQLHKLKFAHCDVRLQNICFNLEGKVKLIDFDRVKVCSNSSKDTRYFLSCEKTNEHLDWKQLVLMILCIKYDCNPKEIDEITTKSIFRNYNEFFLENMVTKKELNNDLLNQFVLLHPGSLLDVLQTRLVNI